MKTVILDTNVFIRFLLNDIPSQTRKAEKIFKEATDRKIPLFVPQIVVFEIDFTLEKFYQIPKQDRIEKLESLISSPYIQVQDKALFQNALLLFTEQNVSLVDCFIESFSKHKNASLFTFDQRLQKISHK